MVRIVRSLFENGLEVNLYIWGATNCRCPRASFGCESICVKLTNPPSARKKLKSSSTSERCSQLCTKGLELPLSTRTPLPQTVWVYALVHVAIVCFSQAAFACGALLSGPCGWGKGNCKGTDRVTAGKTPGESTNPRRDPAREPPQSSPSKGF